MMPSDRKKKKIRRPVRKTGIDPAGTVHKLSLWKRLLFAAVTVVAFFALVEIVLALLGVRPVLYDKDPYVGFSSTIPLFVEQTGPDGKKVMVTAENKLGLFNRQQFPADKDSGTYRIFCMGGSTTFGRPYDDATSFCGWLRAMLPKADPSRSWEVVNAGGVSYASYRMTALMEELIRYEPDLFIIYSGHNEFLERRMYSRIIETPELVRDLGAMASRTRLYTVIESAVYRLGKRSGQRVVERAHLPAEVQTILADSVGPENYYRDDELRKHVLDHVHPTIETNRRLALLLLKTMHDRGIVHFTTAWDDANIRQVKKDVEGRLDEKAHGIALRNLARVFRWAGKFDEGYKLALQAAQKVPDDAEVHTLIGACAVELGHLDEATSSFRQALEIKSDYAEARSSLADVLAGQGLLDEAINHYRRALRDKPDHAKTYCNLGVARSAKGDLEQAVACLHRALEIKPDFAEAHNSLGGVLIAEGKLDEAIHHYNHALQAKPHYIHARYNLASVLRWQGRLDEAAGQFERVLRIRPDFVEAHCGLGLTLLSQGKVEEAIRIFQRVLQIQPDCAEAHSSLGDVLSDLNRLDEAIGHYRQALQADPENAHAHCNLGVALVRQGKWDEAANQFRRAVQIKPDYMEAYNNLGSILAAQGRLKEAINYLRRALLTTSGEYVSGYQSGVKSQSSTVSGQTINHYSQTFQPKADHARVHYNLGGLLVKAGDLSGALENFQEAARLKPSWPDPFNDAAEILATHPDPKVKDVIQAIRLAEHAARLTGHQDVSVLETLAMVYAEADRLDKAVTMIEEAIALASAERDDDRIEALRKKLELYKQGKLLGGLR